MSPLINPEPGSPTSIASGVPGLRSPISLLGKTAADAISILLSLNPDSIPGSILLSSSGGSFEWYQVAEILRHKLDKNANDAPIIVVEIAGELLGDTRFSSFV
jgi:hypothetical protein